MRLSEREQRIQQAMRELRQIEQEIREAGATAAESTEYLRLVQTRPNLAALEALVKQREQQVKLRENLIGVYRADKSEQVPVPAGNGDRPPRPIKRQAPVYPLGLRIAEGKGEVILGFVVNTEGKVEDVMEVPPAAGKPPSDADFVAAAIQAVRLWEFEPGIKNGKPVKTRMQVPIIFNMDPPAVTRGGPSN